MTVLLRGDASGGPHTNNAVLKLGVGHTGAELAFEESLFSDDGVTATIGGSPSVNGAADVPTADTLPSGYVTFRYGGGQFSLYVNDGGTIRHQVLLSALDASAVAGIADALTLGETVGVTKS